jgi:uncharacterized protein (DUF1330 family)
MARATEGVEMPAYVIVMREGPLRDEASYAKYQKIGAESPPAANLKPLVVYGAIQSLEGTPPDGIVILEFPSAEEARAWYEGPGYQAAVPHRIASGDWRAIIVDGL